MLSLPPNLTLKTAHTPSLATLTRPQVIDEFHVSNEWLSVSSEFEEFLGRLHLAVGSNKIVRILLSATPPDALAVNSVLRQLGVGQGAGVCGYVRTRVRAYARV